MKNGVILFFMLAILACKEDKGINNSLPPIYETGNNNIAYAEGFRIEDNGNFSVLEIKNPWPKADETFKYVLISAEEAAKTTFMRDAYNGIIITPIESIVVTSTTHVPSLELLGVEETLKGFPGTDYISSEKTRARIDRGLVRELGKNEGLNTEVLLEINPNLVVAFGVDGKSKTLETIKKANIPVIYNGDWTEKSPLAKAEWIKFFGALYNKEKKADSIFNRIVNNYSEAKQIASKAATKPTVLSGAMHKDVWYLPNGSSTEAQFLEDANTNYLWHDTTGSGSLALNFEVVYEKAKSANLWLSPSYYTSLEDLKTANAHYTEFNAYKNKTIYSFTNTTGKTGGVLYYELGIARPDLVLKDIIKISHPELLPEYQPFFFKALD
ncbi:ABC transporter substrate-binding protein [Lacinutrix neustonica]|uniref:ABC transporter substrate-binding protein n=1 Tax=Lacinutrix neustonica TaxID=2980107 RepID=A0A9E8MYE5_9FLAO|nr:ABC transporter substrate-binding protein [Lacinutrix neustonica]